jgi:TonB-linked SusC/RagA family outer membrane protein
MKESDTHQNVRTRFSRKLLYTLLYGVLTFCLGAEAFGQQQPGLRSPVTLSVKDVTLKEFFSAIEAQTGLRFSYPSTLIADAQPVTLSVTNERLSSVLDQVLKERKLVYALVDNSIIIKNAPASENLTIKGKVVDENGESLPGVNIVIANSTFGTVADSEGNFSLTARTNSDVLIFSMIGYLSQEIPLNNQSFLQVTLVTDVKELTEVVVTALGIEREEKTLGYSVTKVNNEALTGTMPNNWSDALTGKVAGLNLIKSGGGPAGSSKIILRGETSLSGNNGALIVVDGVVISGSSGQLTGQGQNAYLNSDSPIDYGSSLTDLNPEDIESVSVLKGPGASALYGSRGANGAIIITTKKGSSAQKGIGVMINTNAAFATINRWPDYQYEYGQGNGGDDLYYSYGTSEDGPSTFSTSSAWGPKFEGQLYYQYNPDYHRLTPPERTPWVPYRNNRKDFFETAKTFTNSASINGGNDRTSARLSFTNVKNTWIVPNTGYTRNTVSLQVNHKITDKLSVSAKMNYNNRKSDNLPTTGYNNQTIMYFIRGMVPNANLAWFKPYWLPGQEEVAQNRPFSNQLDNPYLQAYEMLNTSKRNGFIGTVEAAYRFTDQLSLKVRTSVDLMYEFRTQRRPKNTQKYADGMYSEQDIYTHEMNSDFLVAYNSKKKGMFTYGLSLGGSVMNNQYRKNEYYAGRLRYPGIYNFANSKDLVIPRPYRREYAVNSLYALGTLGYKEFLFLDVTLREDWASTLASPGKEKLDPFTYPSVNLSAVLSDAFELPRVISFLKIRGSYASVGGGGTTAYLTSYAYNAVSSFPSGLSNPTMLPDFDLKFESTRNVEIGADLRMFGDRLKVDVTAYQSNSFDQILETPVDPSSGYSYQVLNAGNVRNRGIEIEADATPVKMKGGFSWKVYGTFSANRSKIISLADSMQNMVLSTVFGSRGTVEARPGGRYGDIYGLGYERSPDGQIIYDNYGYPLQGDSIIYLGNSTPLSKVSLGHEFKYRQFSLNILFDGQFGGKAYSLTHAVLMEEGKLKKSLPGRYNGIIGDGVIQNGDGSYRQNDIVAGSIRDYYFRHFNRDNLESNMFRTDYVKLREVRLDYTLPAALTKRLHLQRAVFGVYGRDLMVFTKWPAFDPEFGTLGNGDIEKSAEIAQFPSTRTIGVNLTVGI